MALEYNCYIQQLFYRADFDRKMLVAYCETLFITILNYLTDFIFRYFLLFITNLSIFRQITTHAVLFTPFARSFLYYAVVQEWCVAGRVWLDLPISVVGSSYLFYVAMSCPRGALSRCRCRTWAFSWPRHFDVTMLQPLGKKLWHQYLAGML